MLRTCSGKKSIRELLAQVILLGAIGIFALHVPAAAETIPTPNPKLGRGHFVLSFDAQTVSLEANEAPLVNVMEQLAKTVGFEFRGSELTGVTSLSLNNEPLEPALTKLLPNHMFVYSVSPSGEERLARVFATDPRSTSARLMKSLDRQANAKRLEELGATMTMLPEPLPGDGLVLEALDQREDVKSIRFTRLTARFADAQEAAQALERQDYLNELGLLEELEYIPEKHHISFLRREILNKEREYSVTTDMVDFLSRQRADYTAKIVAYDSIDGRRSSVIECDLGKAAIVRIWMDDERKVPLAAASEVDGQPYYTLRNQYSFEPPAALLPASAVLRFAHSGEVIVQVFESYVVTMVE